MAQAATIPTPSLSHPRPELVAFFTRLSRLASVPPIRYGRTADAADIDAMREAVDMAFDVFVSHVGRLLRELNENLPLDNLVRFDDVFNGLADLRSDLSGLMIAAAERE